MALTNVQCKNAKYDPAGKGNKLSDGGGLFLHIKEKGKYWRINYRFLSKQKTFYVGVYPEISLAEAREKRSEIKKFLKEGKDPNSEKKSAKLALYAHYNNNFEALAREWHSQKKHTWTSKHADVILDRFERLIFQAIGQRPITDIVPCELLDVIRRIENRGHRDLAHRMLQHCGQIFRYAVATNRAQTDITYNLKGALQPIVSKNHAYLTEKQLPVFLKELNNYDSVYNGNTFTKLTFQLLILTFVRSGEIRYARWEEFNWDKAEWKIPGDRMKMKSPHIVPLSTQSMRVLKSIYAISGNHYLGYVFPNQMNMHKVMSENTFLRVLKVMGYKGVATAHGFRSTASTILNENGFIADHIERQLAHIERNVIRAAYNHAEYLSERYKLMQWWGDYLEDKGLCIDIL